MYYFSRSPGKGFGRGAGLLTCRGQGAVQPSCCLSRPINQPENSTELSGEACPPTSSLHKPLLPLPCSPQLPLDKTHHSFVHPARISSVNPRSLTLPRHCGACKGLGSDGGHGGWACRSPGERRGLTQPRIIYLYVQGDISDRNDVTTIVEGSRDCRIEMSTKTWDKQRAPKVGL